MHNNTQTDTDANEINFTAFTDLCRFCSLRNGAKINLFDKEAEQRQILYKVRSFLPIAVNSVPSFIVWLHFDICSHRCLIWLLPCIFIFCFRYQKTIFYRKKFANVVFYDWSSCMNGKQYVCKVIQCFEIIQIQCAL